MADWRTWKKGRKTTWHWNEFDGSGSRGGIITEVHEDHAIMEADGKDDINKEHCYALLLTLYRKVQATNIHVADVGRVGGAWLKAARRGL